MPACALMGRVVSQVDPPFSESNSTPFLSVGGSEFFKVVDVSCFFSWRCLVAAKCSALYIVKHEALYCSAADSVGIGIPSPQSLAGSAKTRLSASLMLLRPVMAGIILNRRASSISCSQSPRSGTTRIR